MLSPHPACHVAVGTLVSLKGMENKHTCVKVNLRVFTSVNFHDVPASFYIFPKIRSPTGR